MADKTAADLYPKYVNSSLRFLGFRPRSEKEVREFLIRKKADQQMINRVILQLKELKFLSDNEFAKWWVEQRTRVKHKALRLIKIELKQKGIDIHIIEEAINNIQSTSSNELETAKKAIERRLQKYKGLSKQDVYQKLGPFLQRRGFDY